MSQPAVLLGTDILSEIPPHFFGSPPHGGLGEAWLPLIILSKIPEPPLVMYDKVLN